MGRESYDDMVSSRPRGKSNVKSIALVAVFGVLICAIAVLIVLILSPAEEGQSAETQSPVSVEVRQPEVMQSTVVETEEPVVEEESAAEPVVDVTEESTASAVTAESIRPATETQSPGRTNAIDLVSAQNLAAFDSADALIYITHTVQEGESLESIAQAYGRTVETLVSVNSIRNLSAVVPGIQLRIPNMDGQLYTVQEGDMLSTIAHRFSPDLGWKQLMDVNGLTSESIRVGQELFIPVVIQSEESTLQKTAVSFSGPLDGTVYGIYGQMYNGSNLTGILIGAPAGSAVLASCDGVIVDAGNTADMGRFVVIQHEQGYRSLYYNLETVNATLGSEVKTGDVIGAIGSASSAFDRPTLYFQIEQGGYTLNPALFIE